MSLRTSILLAVCIQNAGYTLIRKYSTMTENVSPKEILLVGEIIKICIAGYLLLDNAETRAEDTSAQGTGVKRLRWLVDHSGKMFVLAMIYAAMNILSFVALQYIGAGEFTICAQLKILSTAGFSVLVLGTSLSWTKWRALSQLVLGCVLVASPNFTAQGQGEADATLAGGNSKAFLQLLGYGAVLTEVLLSGFASIYFERVVKSTTEVVTIWERNFQLAIYSMAVYVVYIMYDVHSGARTSVGTGWTFLTFGVSLFGAVGGLLVAATLKYADSILKTMAAAGAIVLSTVLGHLWMDGPFGLIVCIGAVTTIISIMNYSWDSTESVTVSNVASKQGLLANEEKRGVA